jgi:hypothetical protein
MHTAPSLLTLAGTMGVCKNNIHLQNIKKTHKEVPYFI